MDVDADAVAEVRQMIFGFRITQALRACAELGVSDALSPGPRTVTELAATVGADEDALRRLLRAVSALGLYSEAPPDTFTLGAMGQTLRADHPSRLADIAKNVGRPYFWDTWSHLVDSVRTGENTFEAVHGAPVWTHRQSNPADGLAFDRAMTAMSLGVVDSIVAAFEPRDTRTIVDIGGGHGTLMTALLNANPELRGAVFDAPPVVVGTRTHLESAGLVGRCDAIAGSFFEAVPADFDCYILKSVLHDWEDDECVEILKVCRAAMPAGTRCVIIDRVLPGPNEGLDAKFSDLNMLVMPGGRERTASEFEVVLNAAGMRVDEVLPTASDFRIIEAIAN